MNSIASQFDPQLVARYDVCGPRYTSYPTAPQFHDGFGEMDFRAAVRRSNEEPGPRRLSIYVHVPYCLSPCFYCGCTRIITRDRAKADDYLARLRREIELVAPWFDRDRPVVQLHLGGGTPNFLDVRQMGELLDLLDRHFSLSRDDAREFGIELDPRSCDAGYVRMLAERGFNRISVGIQDFDVEVQRAVNRVQSVEETQAVIEAARSAKMRSVSVDLIYGLPKQTPEKFARTLEQVIALRPDRVACYAYAHLPERFKAQRRIDRADLPDAATRLELLTLTVGALTEAGYRYIGVDHFALPTDDLARAQDAGTLQRNFQGYSTCGDCNLLGLGMSSISHIGDTFSQNARDAIGYFAALDAGRTPTTRGLVLSEDDRIRADAIQRLMCHGALDVHAFEHRHRIDFQRYFAAEVRRLRELETDELVQVTPSHIAVTPRGRYLLRIIAMAFDAYLAKAPDVRYSRAV
jgi:oxygen-independent coproporphyrinogen-3 oxidase